MRMLRGWRLLMLALCTASACAGARGLRSEGPQTRSAAPQEISREPQDPERQSNRGELTTALREALQAGDVDWGLNTWCLMDSGPQSLTVFKGGVAVWGNRKQFLLGHSQARTILKSLLDHDLAGMHASYGGEEDPRVPHSKFATRIICQIDLETGRFRKSSVQFYGGLQYGPLRALAEELLGFGETYGSSGVGAESLSEGLRKISQGELAPELLSLIINRQPGTVSSRDESPGWLLKVQARRVSWVPLPLDPDTPELQIEAGPDEIQRLAEQLWSAGIEKLPGNLYAEGYTDLSLAILDHRKTIQARPFARMDRNAHGVEQGRFDQILRVLYELQERVQKDGRAGS